MKLRAALLVIFVIALVAPTNASAITSVGAADLGNNGGTTNSLTVSYSATVGSSVLYVIVLGDSIINGNNDVTGVTYGGVSGSLQISDAAGTGSNKYKYVYAIFSPPSGANNVVVSATNIHYLAAGVAEYSNSVTHGPPDSTGLNNGGVASSVTGSTTAIATGAWVFGVAEQESNSNFIAGGAGANIRTWDTTFFSWSIFDSNGPVTPGSYSMTATVSVTPPTDLILDMLSFAPSGGGGSLMIMGCCN